MYNMSNSSSLGDSSLLYPFSMWTLQVVHASCLSQRPNNYKEESGTNTKDVDTLIY